MTPSPDFSHLDASGNPHMVDVGGKAITFRQAQAQALVKLTPEILAQFADEEIQTKKGPSSRQPSSPGPWPSSAPMS